MDQWKILVLGVLRLGLNTDYDRIHELANQAVKPAVLIAIRRRAIFLNDMTVSPYFKIVE